MAIHFDCPWCSQTISVDDSKARERVEYPYCNLLVKVPTKSTHGPPPLRPPPPLPSQNMEDSQRAGVGGLLLLFCIYLPLNLLVTFYQYAFAVRVALHAPAFFPVVLPYWIFRIPVSLLGLYTAFLLLTRQRSAIFFVQLFLLLKAAHSLLVSVLAFALAPPEIPFLVKEMAKLGPLAV